jgi:putative effector of murein hydrolase
MLKIIADFLNWCCIYFAWPLFYQINEFREHTIRAFICSIMQLIVTHNTCMYS